MAAQQKCVPQYDPKENANVSFRLLNLLLIVSMFKDINKLHIGMDWTQHVNHPGNLINFIMVIGTCLGSNLPSSRTVTSVLLESCTSNPYCFTKSTNFILFALARKGGSARSKAPPV